MRQIVLDTETTGLSPQQGHRVIEIGAVEMVNRRLTGNKFHHYINPERAIDPGAQKVHGISMEFLADKPVFNDLVAEFIAFIDGSELVIHNAPFDVGFLNHEFSLAGKQFKNIDAYCGVLDTLELARKKHPGQRNNLDALCKRYEVNNSNRQLHGALLDADILSHVYLAMTGGQVTLFGSEKENDNETVNQASQRKPLTRSNKLRVIKANDQELKLHEAFMGEL